jgi:hypothetical protein
MGQKWYHSTAYDLQISRFVFLFYFKSLGPLNLEKIFSAA